MRRFGFLWMLLLLLPLYALADGLSVEPVDTVIRPGRAVLLTFTVPEAGKVDLLLEAEDGRRLSTVVEDFSAAAGSNEIWWNGSNAGVLAPKGDALLVLHQGTETASVPVTVGSMAPYLTSIRTNTTVLTPDTPLALTLYSSENGILSAGIQTDGQWRELMDMQIERGEQSLTWDGAGFDDGVYILTLLLTDDEGDTSTVEMLELTLDGFDPDTVSENSPEGVTQSDPDFSDEALVPLDDIPLEDIPAEEGSEEDNSLPYVDQHQFTPSYGSPYAGQDESLNYWTLPMDITDEAAVWEMLMQPMTVLDNGKDNAQRLQITVRAEPDNSSAGVGMVTCISQGVHVLEQREDWTLIEFYSSSFEYSKIKAWNMLRQGWVETKYLKTVEPNQEVAYVVDKLTQRLYIFQDGHLYDTLLVSTGEANSKQPYNETRSGEFFMQVPAMGGFPSGNLFCAMAIRFNDGDAIHEVPYLTTTDGGKSYATTEYKLGTRASHGCIRVQRRKTPQGVNMKWIWDNKAKYTKLIIWEDWQGRQYPQPSDDLTLYYNPNGGSYYHTAETCNSTKNIAFTPFTYGELEDEAFCKLKRCEWCSAPLRKSEILEIDMKYLPGGDHDPILTKAREKLGLN